VNSTARERGFTRGESDTARARARLSKAQIKNKNK